MNKLENNEPCSDVWQRQTHVKQVVLLPAVILNAFKY
jgi:hypothetical protein